MQREGDVDIRVGQNALLDHHLCAALFAGWRSLFGRLEDELDGAGQRSSTRRKNLGDTHQNGDVGVVPAGVHDPDLLIVVGALLARGIRQVVGLGHRQAVDVRAQENYGPGAGALENRHHAGVGNPGLDLESKILQMLGNSRRGLELAVGKFGVLMEPAAPLDDLRLDRGTGGLGLRVQQRSRGRQGCEGQNSETGSEN